jgi:hypothetical protein
LLLLLLLLAYYHYHYHLYLYIIIIILFIYFLFLPSYSLLSLIFEIIDLMFSDWVSFLAYPNLLGLKALLLLLLSCLKVCSASIKAHIVHINMNSIISQVDRSQRKLENSAKMCFSLVITGF